MGNRALSPGCYNKLQKTELKRAHLIQGGLSPTPIAQHFAKQHPQSFGGGGGRRVKMPHPLPHTPARSIPTALLPLQCKILITARQVSPSWMLTAQSSDLFQPRRMRKNKTAPQNSIRSASQKAESYGRDKQQVLQTPGTAISESLRSQQSELL